ncbi:DUF4097 family beta strand repeat protein [Nibribacter ruber]|uniref:DUF4097 family beta strand repeat protein n=2 Tax=Nibribacter ruber TaxID=2698458 RepID=A0A6P1P4V4_9BACT|nr:DUF4097 family beta strand repeat protein [Nibribacter ruber]
MLTTGAFAQTKAGQPTTNAPQNNARDVKTHKVKLGSGKDKQVQLTVYSSEVEIIGYNGDDVIIETSDYLPASSERAKGLKPLYNQIEDNTGLGLAVEKKNDVVSITKASRTAASYTIKVPKNASILFKEADWTGGDLKITDVDGEIEARLNNSDATLTNVSGPVVANTTAGTIKVIFSALDQSKPFALTAVAGDIDLTFPANSKANFKLESMQGEIYTDFDMDVKHEGKSELPLIGGGGIIDGKTNGGGVQITVKSITSDIYIRKKK